MLCRCDGKENEEGNKGWREAEKLVKYILKDQSFISSNVSKQMSDLLSQNSQRGWPLKLVSSLSPVRRCSINPALSYTLRSKLKL